MLDRRTFVLAVDGAGKVRVADPRSHYDLQKEALRANPALRHGWLVGSVKLGPAELPLPAECSAAGNVCVSGRLGFDDPRGCAPPMVSQEVGWSACHAFKRHFAANGAPILLSTKTTAAYRPLTGRVTVAYGVQVSTGGYDALVGCGPAAVVQSDDFGRFVAVLKRCDLPHVRVRVQVEPIYSTGGSSPKTIRALWPIDAAFQVAGWGCGSEEVAQCASPLSGQLVACTLPWLGFSEDLAEPASPGAVMLGTRLLLPPAAGDAFNYVREVFSAYTTVLELHARLERELFGSAHDIGALFTDEPLPASYTLAFDTGWPHGGGGFLSLYYPSDKAPYRLVSDTSVVAHEFSHSVHAGFAPASLQRDYDFANKLWRPEALLKEVKKTNPTAQAEYDWGHAGGQYQEAGVALIEGFADGVGTFLLNGCEHWIPFVRPQGGVAEYPGAQVFSQNMWNGDDSCDMHDGCEFHHFRWHMVKRGVTEGSADWSSRLDTMRWVSAQASARSGQRFVTSSSETRVSELFCDLLDTDEGIDQAAGIGGTQYLADYTRWIGLALDGALSTSDTLPVSTFGTPAAETASVLLPTLLTGMATFCDTGPDGCTVPASYGTDYDEVRLTTNGKLGAGRLVSRLVSTGAMTLEEGRNLLRTNLMEEAF